MTVCNDDEFKCLGREGGECIEKDYICDGDNDCDWNSPVRTSDEANCGSCGL